MTPLVAYFGTDLKQCDAEILGRVGCNFFDHSAEEKSIVIGGQSCVSVLLHK